jgi:hypothetical protein
VLLSVKLAVLVLSIAFAGCQDQRTATTLQYLELIAKPAATPQ